MVWSLPLHGRLRRARPPSSTQHRIQEHSVYIGTPFSARGAQSSANLTGQPAAITAQRARAQLSYKVSVSLEAGVCPRLTPSTIIDLTGERPKLVRVGAISADQICEAIGWVEVIGGVEV